MIRGAILGVLATTVIFACACMREPVQAEPIQEPQSKPVMVPYTNQTVEQFANINNYRKMQLSEEDATFSETCNFLECVGAFEPTYEEPEQTEQAPKRKTKRLDRGKIGALREAGWTFQKIAEEMGCNVNTVYRIVQELESLKEVKQDGQD